jgi:hypothetical protein
MNLKTIMVVLALTVPFFLMTVWAIVDSLQRDFSSIRQKVLWCLVAAIPFAGSIFYFLFGIRQGRKPQA